MAEENDDLKLGEKKTPEGTGQPEKKPTETGEEKVEISKSTLEQLQKDAGLKENYRKGLIRLNKARGRILPESESDEEPKRKEPEEEFDEFGEPIKKAKKEEFVTKKELVARDEKDAIAEACQNEEIALNWEDIVIFYVPPKENTKEGKKQAIFDAHRRWRAEQGMSEKPEDQGKKDTKDLATDKGLSKGKEKDTGQKPEKKSIFPKKEKMSDWYK
jgi:hypothetical protein